MGEESIMRPPASKKAAITSAHSWRRMGSSPTLNVIHVPSPIAHMGSPDEGMVRIRGACSAAGATTGKARTAAQVAPAFTKALRVMILFRNPFNLALVCFETGRCRQV
ncbi:hypothetical protein GCM10007937_00470 [Mesorhizobium albiziae]|nr:hypothetical protein GCM10007937_00470 [Mesorhizobium albiziae]